MVGEKWSLAATDARPGGPCPEAALPEEARPEAARPGDADRWREVSQPQPGGRDPAPGELALVQSFINSHYDLVVEHGRDLLGTPAGLDDWLAARGMIGAPHVPLSAEDRLRAVAIREALRALAGNTSGLAAGNTSGPAAGNTSGLAAGAYADLNGAARGAPVEIRFSERGPGFVAAPAAAPLDRALGVLLAIAARAMIDGSWARLKVCPGDHCGWAFYDHSRNQSGRWCSMAVCGGRAKARSHYRRTRLGGS